MQPLDLKYASMQSELIRYKQELQSALEKIEDLENQVKVLKSQRRVPRR